MEDAEFEELLEKATHSELSDLVKVLAGKVGLDEENVNAFCENLRAKILQEKLAAVQNTVNAMELSLPNAEKSQPYTAQAALPAVIEGYPVIRAVVDGLEESGLACSYNQETAMLQLEGTPVITGEVPMDLVITLQAEDGQEYHFHRPLYLVVNVDPRELWQDIPVPEDIPFPKPDTDICFLPASHVQEKCIAAASRRGRSHAHKGTPRDDHFNIGFDPETGWYVLTVADGAGSAKFSREGSKVACNTVVDSCRKGLSEKSAELENLARSYYNTDKGEPSAKALREKLYYFFGKASVDAYKAIEALAAASGSSTVRDFATTIMVTIAKKVDNFWFVGAFWIGDGAVALYTESTEPTVAEEGQTLPPAVSYLHLMGKPDGGEYAGQTRFLTMPNVSCDPQNILNRVRFDCVDDFTALFLMTDGVSDPKFVTDNNLGTPGRWDAFWQELKEQNPALATRDQDASTELLEWLLFWVRGEHDDRTIAILY